MIDDHCMDYDQTLRNAGKCLASEALQPVRTAATVRVRDGKMSVRDGPFAETKECLAGFYLIDAGDLNEAIQIASQIPPPAWEASRCGRFASWSAAPASAGSNRLDVQTLIRQRLKMTGTPGLSL